MSLTYYTCQSTKSTMNLVYMYMYVLYRPLSHCFCHCTVHFSHIPHTPHRCVPLVEQERYVELVGRVRADKREAERLREAAKKNMEKTEVRNITREHCTRTCVLNVCKSSLPISLHTHTPTHTPPHAHAPTLTHALTPHTHTHTCRTS